jgi:hypothetical protein
MLDTRAQAQVQGSGVRVGIYQLTYSTRVVANNPTPNR